MCEERRAATTVVGGRPVIIMQRLNAPSSSPPLSTVWPRDGCDSNCGVEPSQCSGLVLTGSWNQVG
jgi:hypothetical protein